MKNLTTNQWLLLGGTIALIYLLFGKNKMKASEIKEEIQKDLGETGGLKPIPQMTTKSDCAELEKKWLQYSMTVKFTSLGERERQKREFMGDCYKPSVKGISPFLPTEKIAIVTR